jgi:predicted nucleotidyltransferase
MAKKPSTPVRYRQPYRYASPDIPLSAIRRFTRQIVERFRPEKIILFGSYAYGTPHEESDVDLMVIMKTRNVLDEAVRIGLAFERPFSFDLHVRTPRQIERGLKKDDRDWFLYEVMTKGKILYEAPHSPVGAKSRGGLANGVRPIRVLGAAAGSRVLPLSAKRGKVPQGSPPGTRRRHTPDS